MSTGKITSNSLLVALVCSIHLSTIYLSLSYFSILLSEHMPYVCSQTIWFMCVLWERTSLRGRWVDTQTLSIVSNGIPAGRTRREKSNRMRMKLFESIIWFLNAIRSLLASCSDDKTAKIWTLNRGLSLFSFFSFGTFFFTFCWVIFLPKTLVCTHWKATIVMSTHFGLTSNQTHSPSPSLLCLWLFLSFFLPLS